MIVPGRAEGAYMEDRSKQPDCCSQRHKERSPEEVRCLVNRLNRIAEAWMDRDAKAEAEAAAARCQDVNYERM